MKIKIRMSLSVFGMMLLMLVLPPGVPAATVEFTLLTHADNIGRLAQPKAQEGVSGDHLLQTSDDITGASYNPNGCFSFNFMNPVGVMEPDYPAGYAEGIHSMTGSMSLDVDLATGGDVDIEALAFDGYVATNKTSIQQLVYPGGPATDGNHGPVDGQPNSGSYLASAALNWALTVNIDWYYDTPFAGHPGIDITLNDYLWNGFIIPVCELTEQGMANTMLDDSLGYFAGSSEDFESWLLDEVAGRLPENATHLLLVQGEAHPHWTNPMMGMPIDGIVGETIIAYAVPEPGIFLLLAFGGIALLRKHRE